MAESAIRQVRDDFDWSSLRFPGERFVRAEVERESALAPILAEYCDREKLLPGSFRGGGLVASAAVSPAVAWLADLIGQVLQLSCPVELELVAASEPTVDVVPAEARDPIRLRVAGGYLAGLTLRESLFWLGREVGRRLLSQVPLVRDPSHRSAVGERGQLLLRGLWRFQVMACDRFGLLCCQDESTALGMMIRQLSNLPESLLSGAYDDWIEDRLPEEEAMISPCETEFLRLRAAALLKFAASPRYQQAFRGPAHGSKEGAFPARLATTLPVGLPAIRPIAPLAFPAEPATPLAAAERTTPPAAAERTRPAEQGPARIEYRPIAGDPSVAEMVYVTGEAPAPPVRELSADAVSAARRDFAVAASFWLVGLSDQVSDRQRDMLIDHFGAEVFQEVRPIFQKRGMDGFVERCRTAGEKLSQTPRLVRFELLKELGRIAMTDNPDLARSEPVLTELARLLGLAKDDLTMAMGDYVDSQYASYVFTVGERVEVHLDGEWMTGTVEGLDPQSGEVRVRFTSGGKPLRLHPLSDWIRPLPIKRAS